MNRISKIKALSLIVVVLGVLYLAYSFLPNSSELPSSGLINDQLKVHFIDVGQGDATLLMGPDFTVLVDAGRHDRNDVVPYLKEQNVQQIDLLIGTHPHADHIGQFPQVLNNFLVKEVWLSGELHTSRTFERAIDAILATSAKYHEPRTNDNFMFGSLKVEILHPSELTGDLNNGSIAFRAIFGDIIFMFTGDAEFDAELEIVKSSQNLKSHILQIGHHGSKTSSTSQFLRKVSPELAVYSAGLENGYGHPHPEIIDRMNSLNIKMYGTDINGTVVLTTDGKVYHIESQNEQEERVYYSD
ncbi:MAG: ComEC/Rec2 family competence protein [Balneolaceae bacterium]|nr:ComEC/Rec2 family competence protein [Balneolaceae bacterium]